MRAIENRRAFFVELHRNVRTPDVVVGHIGALDIFAGQALLGFDFAVVTFAAGGRRSPGHPIADFQRVSGPVAFQSFTEPGDVGLAVQLVDAPVDDVGDEQAGRVRAEVDRRDPHLRG